MWGWLFAFHYKVDIDIIEVYQYFPVRDLLCFIMMNILFGFILCFFTN